MHSKRKLGLKAGSAPVKTASSEVPDGKRRYLVRKLLCVAAEAHNSPRAAPHQEAVKNAERRRQARVLRFWCTVGYLGRCSSGLPTAPKKEGSR